MKNIIININNITKIFKNKKILQNINFKIKRGEFLSILGPSGCGKTTLLRIISGIEKPTFGSINIINPIKNSINLIFQNYALFSHMNVINNILFPIKKVNKTKNLLQYIDKIIDLMNIKNILYSKIETLSGGQKQRIAIARALAMNTKILLLDEPFNALDIHVKEKIIYEIKKIQRIFSITLILVTHDQKKALSISDRIAIINSGILHQIDKPYNIYRFPVNRTVSKIIGNINILYIKIIKKVICENFYIISTQYNNNIYIKRDNKNIRNFFYLILRPEIILIKKFININNNKYINILKGTISDIFYKGYTSLFFVNIEKIQKKIAIEVFNNNFENYKNYYIGEKIYCSWNCGNEIIVYE